MNIYTFLAFLIFGTIWTLILSILGESGSVWLWSDLLEPW